VGSGWGRGPPPADAPGHKATAVLVALQVPARAGHQIAHVRRPGRLLFFLLRSRGGARAAPGQAPHWFKPISSRVRRASTGRRRAAMRRGRRASLRRGASCCWGLARSLSQHLPPSQLPLSSLFPSFGFPLLFSFIE
jgi:hypothetical protein